MRRGNDYQGQAGSMTMTLAQLEALVTAQDAEIKRLRRDVGDFEKPIDLTKPPAELPNKEYPVAFRQRQLGVGIDSLTDTVAAGGGGAASSSAPPIDAQTIAQLLAGAFDVHFAMQNGRGYLSIGMPPDLLNQSPIQVGGRVAAEIAGYSDTTRVAGDGPGAKDSCNTVVLADGDGGMKWRQYQKYNPDGSGLIRNTPNRNASNIGFDSAGELCQSVLRPGQTKDGGQLWYIRFDWAKKVIRWIAFQTGWTIELDRSTTYGGGEVDVTNEKIAAQT